MKKLISLCLTLWMTLALLGSAFAQASPTTSTDTTDEPVTQAHPTADGATLIFRPSPFNREPDAFNDYAYMGISFEIPELLLEKILANEVFMLVDGDVDYGYPENFSSLSMDEMMAFVVDYNDMLVRSGYVDFLFIPEEARDGMPTMDKAMAGDYMDYDAFLIWKEALSGLAKLSVYHQDFLPEVVDEQVTGYPNNEVLGTYGEYTFIFSANDDLPEAALTLQAEVDALRNKLTVGQPRPIDDRFSHIAAAYTEDAEAITGFSTTDIQGNPVDASIFKNAKLTMVNIWTTWCSPCIQEMPDLGEIARELGGEDFQLIGLLQDGADTKGKTVDEEKVALAQTIVEKTGVTYPILIPDEVLAKDVLASVLGYPTTYFVDQDGKVVGESILGSKSKDEWIKVIEEMLDIVSNGAGA